MELRLNWVDIKSLKIFRVFGEPDRVGPLFWVFVFAVLLIIVGGSFSWMFMLWTGLLITLIYFLGVVLSVWGKVK